MENEATNKNISDVQQLNNRTPKLETTADSPNDHGKLINAGGTDVVHSGGKASVHDDKLIIRNYKEVQDPDADFNPVGKKNGKTAIPLYDFSEDMRAPFPYLYAFLDSAGQRYLLDAQNPSRWFKSLTEMQPWLSEKGLLLDFKGGNPIVKEAFFGFLKENAPTISRFSLLPESESDPSTLYLGKGVFYPDPAVCEPNGWFRKLMATFTTATRKDEIRLAAALLTAFLPRCFDGRKPLFGLVAPSRSAGKTTVVDMASRILQGQSPLMMEGASLDDRAINGLPGLANRMVLVDNLVQPSTATLTHLSRMITDPTRPAWFFREAHLRVPNNKVYFATYNSEECFNTDLIARQVIIRLKGKDVLTAEEHARIMYTLDDFEKNHRQDIITDILAGINAYNRRKAEVPTYTVNAPEKFPQWGKEISALVSIFYPEEACFDFGLSEADQMLDSETRQNQSFVEYLGRRFFETLETKDFHSEELATLYSKYLKSENLGHGVTAHSFAQKWPRMIKELVGFEVSPIETGHARGRVYRIHRIEPLLETSLKPAA